MTFLILYTVFMNETQVSKMSSPGTCQAENQMRRNHEAVWKNPAKSKGRKPYPPK